MYRWKMPYFNALLSRVFAYTFVVLRLNYDLDVVFYAEFGLFLQKLTFKINQLTA
jgi:hypothetical protein